MDLFFDCEKKEENFEKSLKDKFRAKLRVAPEIGYLSITELKSSVYPENSRKAVKFKDDRK